ncbi:hypothetical protein JCM1841_004179 [Sporobolomyces salmonicolor]
MSRYVNSFTEKAILPDLRPVLLMHAVVCPARRPQPPEEHHRHKHHHKEHAGRHKKHHHHRHHHHHPVEDPDPPGASNNAVMNGGVLGVIAIAGFAGAIWYIHKTYSSSA